MFDFFLSFFIFTDHKRMLRSFDCPFGSGGKGEASVSASCYRKFYKKVLVLAI